MGAVQKKSANLSLDPALVREAKALSINLSQAAEAGLRAAVAEAKSERWRAENAQAIDGYNRWIEDNGLPLDKFRQF
ncbi:type II toxin-antitoxin system CcdA family antitoxin [Rhodospirillaceae bacterium KN72]|uniref:Type II toxin-antitoxin system CcdA family antitoxin n=1 Tax=Pacificispira spongiicola TaxID=2729598 RepID=A0A7Y0E201_9PROT|nr:type II toxin-antitoxin system CcdA family antitoxin [Pacificispira spongiicola]NMM45775.1 type II toxin-antitoxin system CcdA family antitoxin [Pacificispira spongiicola]